jgi:CRISPR-associated endonuclease/helicase Cas3
MTAIELVLAGIDGANPLGFLAAVGTLRSLAFARPVWAPRLSWQDHGVWRPVLTVTEPMDADKLLDALAQILSIDPTHHPAACWELFQLADFTRLRGAYLGARADAGPASREAVDYLGALGSDLPAERGGVCRSPIVLPRSDYFRGNVQQIVKDTVREHLRRALFKTWDYADPLDNRSLRFDPSEDRRHALQLHAPTDDPGRKKRGNMLGANRLALEAIPLFTCHYARWRPETTALRYNRELRVYEFTWPIWQAPITLDSVASLLCLPQLRAAGAKAEELHDRGIAAVYRAKRLELGGSQKKFNFAPGEPVC